MDASSLRAGFHLDEWLVLPEDGSVASPQFSARLEPQLMELLVYLCSRPRRVVSKQQVLDAVWHGRFISDETLKGSLYQLRKTLHDDPRRPRFIETLPRRGYRMLVHPTPVVSTDAVPDDADPDALSRKGHAALTAAATPAALAQARLYFERALALRAGHTGALRGLTRTGLLTIEAGAGDPREVLAQIGHLATRLDTLAAPSADAALGRAIVAFLDEYDPAAADREFRAATSLAPHDSLAHRWYARFLSTQHRHDEAIAEARRAVACDPLALGMRRAVLDAQFFARRYDEVVAEAQTLFEVSPGMPDVHLGMVWVHWLRHDEPRAFDAFVAGLTSLGVAPAAIEGAREIFARTGMTGIFALWLEHLDREAVLGRPTTVDRLAVQALLGDADRCFTLLDAALEAGQAYVGWTVAISPIFDVLRGDPRYRALVARLTQPIPNR